MRPARWQRSRSCWGWRLRGRRMAMSGMTSDKLEELRRIAEAATPGPWWVDGWEARTKDGDRFIASIAPAFQGASPDASCWEVDANIQHIAAFDPTTVLPLLNRGEELSLARASALRGVGAACFAGV